MPRLRNGSTAALSRSLGQPEERTLNSSMYTPRYSGLHSAITLIPLVSTTAALLQAFREDCFSLICAPEYVAVHVDLDGLTSSSRSVAMEHKNEL